MSTAPLRKDAARNWQRIVDVGRLAVDGGISIQLNDVARTAGVGVATVYRHFPTPEALLETIAAPGLAALVAHAEQALAASDPWHSLRDFLYAATEAQVTDPSLAPVFATPESALPATAEAKRRLVAVFGALLARARAAGAVDPAVSADDIVPLMCGVMFAARVHPPADRAEHAATVRRYLTTLLNGVRARPAL
ncbi:TetR/AcrR family transcriptional regulator [Actinoplanes sp. NPDC051851]|uniref:TetR/AcrR family transcriptional regulator n=1 Tax=Actinoplanes sp. NPDC051851 TaxID=3154753 RepID=UPI003429A365